MNRSEVLGLARRRGSPAVSVLVPLDAGAPVPEQELLVRSAHHRGVLAAARWWDDAAAAGVAARLRALDLALPVERWCDGLASFATPEGAEVRHLPFPVVDQVVVDTTFATRQLFEGTAEHPPYWLVALDHGGARLFTGQGRRLAAVDRQDLPAAPVAAGGPSHPPHHDRPRHEWVRHADDRAWAHELRAALGGLPTDERDLLVLVGDHRIVDELDLPADHGPELVGVVDLDAHGADLARLVAAGTGAVAAHVARHREAALSRLAESEPASVVASLPGVVDAALAGRVEELVVEHGFAVPRRWVDGLSASTRPDPSLDVEDVVDDVVERVLLEGGHVTFVPTDGLGAQGHIAARLRW